jgi:hypothetical protein
VFDVASCIDAARGGRLDGWIHAYLSGGPWANPGLSEGLRRQPRYWIGPLLVPLDRMQRCCGPEAEMEYRVPLDAWQRKVSDMASSLAHPMSLPPLIVEWRSGTLSIRDGNPRHAAMSKTGWRACWIAIWCNSLADHKTARQQRTRLRGNPLRRYPKRLRLSSITSS